MYKTPCHDSPHPMMTEQPVNSHSEKEAWSVVGVVAIQGLACTDLIF